MFYQVNGQEGLPGGHAWIHAKAPSKNILHDRFSTRS